MRSSWPFPWKLPESGVAGPANRSGPASLEVSPLVDYVCQFNFYFAVTVTLRPLSLAAPDSEIQDRCHWLHP
jgi:hypothetical protein